MGYSQPFERYGLLMLDGLIPLILSFINLHDTMVAEVVGQRPAQVEENEIIVILKTTCRE